MTFHDLMKRVQLGDVDAIPELIRAARRAGMKVVDDQEHPGVAGVIWRWLKSRDGGVRYRNWTATNLSPVEEHWIFDDDTLISAVCFQRVYRSSRSDNMIRSILGYEVWLTTLEKP